MKNRKGTFKITKALIDNNPDGVIKTLANVLVLRCEYIAIYDHFEYHGISKLFDETEEGQVIPEYGFIISFDGKVTCFTSENSGAELNWLD